MAGRIWASLFIIFILSLFMFSIHASVTAAATTDTIGSTGAASGGYGALQVYRIQASASGILQTINVYVSNYGGANIQAVIYSDHSLQPYLLLCQSNPNTPTGNNYWDNVSVSSCNVPITGGDWYWIGYQQQTNSNTFPYSNAGGNGRCETPLNWNNAPSPFAPFNFCDSAYYNTIGMTYAPSSNSAPQFYGNTSSTPASYSSTPSSFSVSWKNSTDQMNNAIIQLDSANYTMTQAGQNSTFTNYQFNITLGAGSHNFILFGNTTAGLQNSTADVSFTIGKASTSLILAENVSSPITYPTASSVSCTMNPAWDSIGGISLGSFSLYRYGTPYLQQTSYATGNYPLTIYDNITLGAGNFNYNCTYAGNANWTANNTATFPLLISKAYPPAYGFYFTIVPAYTIPYPTQTTVTGFGCPSFGAADVSCSLWNNGVSVSNPDIETFPSTTQTGITYFYNWTTTGGQNWTATNLSLLPITIITIGGFNISTQIINISTISYGSICQNIPSQYMSQNQTTLYGGLFNYCPLGSQWICVINCTYSPYNFSSLFTYPIGSCITASNINAGNSPQTCTEYSVDPPNPYATSTVTPIPPAPVSLPSCQVCNAAGINQGGADQYLYAGACLMTNSLTCNGQFTSYFIGFIIAVVAIGVLIGKWKVQ